MQAHGSPDTKGLVIRYTKRILRYLKGTLDFGILYSRNDNSQLVGYSDSDYAGCKMNRKSMTGIVWTYGGDVISYKCKQQSTIADSSMYAELIAMTSAAKEGVYLRKLVGSIHSIPPTTLLTDNNAALSTSIDHRITERNKHIEVKHFLVRQFVEQNLISPSRIPTDENISDVMTKPSKSRLKQSFLRNRMHIVPCPSDKS